MNRLLRLLLLLLCAVPLSARVLSYAPYTDRLSARGDQLRTTRHFVLVEMSLDERHLRTGQVVLYDSKAIDAPRVVFPSGSIYFAALYQEHEHLPPTILVATANPRATHISTNGGRSWRRIRELDDLVPHTPGDVDYGGPWTNGLAASVRIGTSTFPFVVAYRSGVYAIPRAGSPRLLVGSAFGMTSKNPLIGQNREGTEFVILTGSHTFAAVNLSGRARPLGRPLPGMDAAWIAPDCSVYAVVHEGVDQDTPVEHRELHLYRNKRSQLVLRPRSGTTFVAIPTHDFSGAWISEAHGVEGTTLWRHRPGGELEMMWRVVAGSPQIEALHAGASGKTLLIQVHRPRAVQTQFIDPALAIWRAGEPAPAGYDELFLREGPYKGFVHADVDRMAEGDPFVFDSSFARPPAAEPVSPPIGGGGGSDVMQEWGVVRASLKQRLVVPGAIRAPGQWITELTIYNPLDVAQRVAITFGEATKNVTLDAGEIRVVRDVLGTLFDVEDGSGSLHVVPQAVVNVTARVYTERDGGTRGYTIGAIDFFNVASPRFPVTFAGAFPGPGFRTRLLLTDTSGGGLKADVTTTSAGGMRGTGSIEARSVRHEELSSPDTGGLIVRPAQGTGIAGVVVVDDRSGDPTYFPPDLPATADIRTIPFVAHVDEANGVTLRSDLHILNFSSQVRRFTLEIKPYDTNQWPRQQTYTLQPYESRIIEDPLKTLFNLSGIARLRYWSHGALGDSAGVRVTSRTYRTSADGGTSGSLVPPMNNFQSVTGSESLEMLLPIGNARVTLGLIELTNTPRPQETVVRIHIYDERSRLLQSFDKAIRLAAGVMIDDLFAVANVAAPAAARIVVEPLDNIGLVSAYALLTDPVTGDTSFIAPNLGARKDE